MLIEDYDVEVFTPPCERGAERFAARARLSIDISEALPYLNATLRGAVYHREANALTWKKGGHSIAFHPYEIATSNVETARERRRSSTD
jgi:ArsR family metal-binding transcriptional regulator